MINLSHDELRRAVHELEQALYNHGKWAEALFSTLICRLPADERDLEVDAHKRCSMGQWLYSPHSEVLTSHPGFEELRTEHERMHHCARLLLAAMMENEPIEPEACTGFNNALERMRLEAVGMKREFQDALNNLDPLTSTFNQVSLLTKLREERELVKRGLHECCLAMIDLDNFKSVNDTYGHAVGDRVLTTVAQYLLTNLRPYDRVFRYGGEEFLLCLPGVAQDSGLQIVEKLREGLAEMQHESGEGTFSVTVSCGLTLLDPDFKVEQSIDRAEKALYFAKNSGRNKTILWNIALNGSAPIKSVVQFES